MQLSCARLPTSRRWRNHTVARATTTQRGPPVAMQYYTYPLAYAPGKVALALAEKGITPAKQQVVDLMNGQSLNPEFMRLNPAGTVPVLVDGSTTLRDSK